MNTDAMKYIALAAAVLIIQVLVLNNIHLFGCATPLMLVYVVMLLPANTPRWIPVAGGFVLGLLSDIFVNTPGVGAASLTLVGMVQPVYLHLFMSRESPDDLVPSVASLGFTKYAFYTLLLLLLFVSTFFALEEFSFFHWQQYLLLVGGSAAITYLLIFVIETVRGRQ